MSLFRRFSRKHQATQTELPPYDLERPLVYFSETDPWRIKDACEGTQIFGATGSGKTSGSGQTLAKAFLNAGFGGLVLTAKSDERILWERYAEATNRQDSLIIFSPSNKWRFNFLDYESRRPGIGAGFTENLVSLFCTVLEIAERKQGQQGQDYWMRALKQLLRNAIDLITISQGTLSLMTIYDVIMSAPQSVEESNSEAWQQSSACFRGIYDGEEVTKDTDKSHDFELSAKYFLSEYPCLAEKTRSVIVSTFTSMADCFLRGTLRELFCTTTNIVPELTHEGAIIILDLPVKEFSELGQYSQVLFKLIWQRATERRDITQNPRPNFLWADEAQYFTNSYDMQFQTTARSSRACTVYLTQNISNYYASFAGERGRAETDSLLGNLQTKIFHANGDSVTNNWASELFCKNWRSNVTHGSSSALGSSLSAGQYGTNDSETQNHSVSQTLEYDVMQREFTVLRKGGRENDLCVDAIIFQGGRIWDATGGNYLNTTFLQQ